MSTEKKRLAAIASHKARENRMIVVIKGVGAIEDVYGTMTSFNVYKFLKSAEPTFYKSAYTFDTAKKLLEEVKQNKIKKDEVNQD